LTCGFSRRGRIPFGSSRLPLPGFPGLSSAPFKTAPVATGELYDPPFYWEVGHFFHRMQDRRPGFYAGRRPAHEWKSRGIDVWLFPPGTNPLWVKPLTSPGFPRFANGAQPPPLRQGGQIPPVLLGGGHFFHRMQDRRPGFMPAEVPLTSGSCEVLTCGFSRRGRIPFGSSRLPTRYSSLRQRSGWAFSSLP